MSVSFQMPAVRPKPPRGGHQEVGHWEEMGSWGRALTKGISALRKETPGDPSPLPPREDPVRASLPDPGLPIYGK